MSLGLLGNVNIHEKLDTAYWMNVRLFNENVTKNRYVLSKVIDCIKFCGFFELALRGHDETSTSENPGIFRGLINFTAEQNSGRSYEKFQRISKDIQNDILDCMLEICHGIILEEIRTASYISIIADETMDVSAKSQMVVVFRYIKNGDPVERFWTYLEPQNLTAESLTADILRILDPILENSKDKLIAQSYDGATVMSGRNTGVQARIKEKYNFAHFVYCYAHQLNLIMSQAASQSSQVRTFFGNLQEIPSFFKNSPQRVDVFFNELQKRKIDPVEINQKIQSFEQNIMTIRNSIDEIINEATDIISSLDCEPMPSKRRRNNDSQFDHRIAALEVCDTIINCAKDRFGFKNHLLAASLLYSDQFANYINCFPDGKLSGSEEEEHLSARACYQIAFFD
nr:unnamed protein product [Callosobruchus analis]